MVLFFGGRPLAAALQTHVMAKCEWIVAVHGGAAQGYLGDKSRKKYEKVMVEACRRASELLEAGGSAVDAAKLAVEVLEDDATTNAGFGSNLTLDGTVEVLFHLFLSLCKMRCELAHLKGCPGHFWPPFSCICMRVKMLP